MVNESYILSNGEYIPAIGFGVGTIKRYAASPKSVVSMWMREKYRNVVEPEFKANNQYKVKNDLKKRRMIGQTLTVASQCGIRLFDTARAYQDSEMMLKKYIIDEMSTKDTRSEYYIITKLSNTAQREGTIEKEFERSLNELGTDYVDCYLMHWPQSGTFLNAWKEMEEIYRSGRVKAIGVCNCHIHHLKEIMEICDITPMVNEIECHPLLQQNAVRNFCKEHRIQIIAHTPTCRMSNRMRNSDVMHTICNAHNASLTQVIMRWHFQLGDIPIPNTSNVEHLRENITMCNELSEDEMKLIATLDCGFRIWPDSDNCDFSKL